MLLPVHRVVCFAEDPACCQLMQACNPQFEGLGMFVVASQFLRFGGVMQPMAPRVPTSSSVQTRHAQVMIGNPAAGLSGAMKEVACWVLCGVSL